MNRLIFVDMGFIGPALLSYLVLYLLSSNARGFGRDSSLLSTRSIIPIILFPGMATVLSTSLGILVTMPPTNSEFKEAFPAGRFRPLCKIQAKRGGSSTVVADTIKPPNWWHSTRIIQAFDAVLQEKMKKPSLFKRISSLGIVKRPPQLSAAEQLVQLSIRKRATAFVDARDDLETKIGRLSRRLNFLMTESDLWRDKFVTFEQYAEKLSLEANELRSKINKEQRETKRLSGLVTMTAVEKTKLQNRRMPVLLGMPGD